MFQGLEPPPKREEHDIAAIAPYSEPSSFPTNAYPPTSTQNSHSSSQPPPINGMFLGLERPQPGPSFQTHVYPPVPSSTQKNQSSSQLPPNNGMFLGFESPPSGPSFPANTYPPVPSSTQTYHSSSQPTLINDMSLGFEPPTEPKENDVGAITPYSKTSFPTDAYPPVPTSTQTHHSSSQPPPINGMFLGLEPPPEPEEDDVDKEFRQAEEAALYAQELLKQQAQERQAKAARGPLGFGLLPKTQRIWNDTAQELSQRKSQLHEATSQISLPSISTRTGEAKQTPGDETGLPTSELPPWYSRESEASHVSDYGVNSDTPSDTSNPSEPKKSSVILGASVLGGVAGLVAVGPLAGVVAAGGLAYASAKDGHTGKALRGAGRMVAKAGSAAHKFEGEHHVLQTTASGVVQAVGWVAKKGMGKET